MQETRTDCRSSSAILRERGLRLRVRYSHAHALADEVTMASLKGIVIKQPWIGLILEGKKTWEIRSRPVKLRGPVGLVQGGSGKVMGIGRIVGCIGPMSRDEVLRHFEKHRVPPERMHEVDYEQFYAWELADVRRLDPPVPYRHRSGAVIWVDLDQASVGDNLPRLLNEAGLVPSEIASSPRPPTPTGEPPAAKAKASPAPAPAASSALPSRFGPERVAGLLREEFGPPRDATKYAYRWSIGPKIGIGVDRRGSGTVTVFCGTGVDLFGSSLSVERVQTRSSGAYGVNSNMKSVPGCEPGSMVQRVLLRSDEDVQALSRRVRGTN